MKNSWVSMKSIFGASPNDGDEYAQALGHDRQPLFPAGPPASQPQTAQPAPAAERFAPAPAHTSRVLDAVGQQNEAIRIRLNNLLERFDDVISLRSEFNTLVEPVVGLISEYPRVNAKLAETEQALDLHRETIFALKNEARETQSRMDRVQAEMNQAASERRRLEAQNQESEALAAEFRSKNKQLDLIVADIENQLSAEIQRARSVAEENQALRAEAQAADQAATRFERDLAEAQEKLELLEQENKALHRSLADQNQAIVTQTNKLQDLDHQLLIARQQLASVEEKLANDNGARQRIEAQYEAERQAQQVNTSALEMKVEGLAGRLAATEKILANARDQIRERNEVVRASERSMREAIIERNALQRRLEGSLQEIDRKTAQSAEEHKSRSDLADRTDTLLKAINAKESLLKEAETLNDNLTARLTVLEERFDKERNALEAANKRLTEELSQERSERSLSQGALEAARERVTELQTQFLTFKNSSRYGETADGGKPLPT